MPQSEGQQHLERVSIHKGLYIVMDNEFNTVFTEGKGEYADRRSRFIGQAFPCGTPPRAMERIAAVTQQYYDARHHCYAYICGEHSQIKKACDDGEPQGSAGIPILNVLEKAGCTNALIIVTRYFGGILLGTGGLVRAYTAAAQRALEDAGIVRMQRGMRVRLQMEYSLLDRVNYFLQSSHIRSENQQYSDRVQMEIIVRCGELPDVLSRLNALGSGTISAEQLQEDYFPFDIEETRG